MEPGTPPSVVFGERFVTVGDLERMLAMAGEIVGRVSRRLTP